MSRAPVEIGGLFDWRSWSVFQRNARVYFRNWRTAFLPPAMEPVIFFLAFGLGLGSYIGHMNYDGQSVNYGTYVAPGLLAYTAFSTPFFEALYSSYVRMFYQKTFDGILATQVEMRHVVWGEITWAGARGAMNSAVVALVLCVFHLFGLIEIAWWTLPLLVPIAFIAGWAFGAFALVFTAIVPSIDHMNYPVFLIGIPLGLVSNTYFPIESDNAFLQAIIEINPIYHLAETFRAFLLTGRPDMHALWLLVSITGVMGICVFLSQRLMKRRVLGE
jgi:lipooligosaccharide transport system permease protein